MKGVVDIAKNIYILSTLLVPRYLPPHVRSRPGQFAVGPDFAVQLARIAPHCAQLNKPAALLPSRFTEPPLYAML